MSDPFIDLPRPYARKVWVLNRSPRGYSEEFRGQKIFVPPNEEKKVTMGLLEAERFLGVPVTPTVTGPDGRWISGGKPLYIQELTEDERNKIEGKPTKKDFEAAKKEEKDQALACTICGQIQKNAKGLKIHVSHKHPEFEPVEEK